MNVNWTKIVVTKNGGEVVCVCVCGGGGGILEFNLRNDLSCFQCILTWYTVYDCDFIKDGLKSNIFTPEIVEYTTRHHFCLKSTTVICISERDATLNIWTFVTSWPISIKNLSQLSNFPNRLFSSFAEWMVKHTTLDSFIKQSQEHPELSVF